ncbi:MAG: Replication factor A [Methanomethylovorans sp. PtaU1.Bin093]|jgi:replication factor A1|uniref:OB-fold nucleic acid binding domain-containing protein n=1 Tax=Methanomethylovorans sp. PtaU1.Bin093 TaxID=1811679 RepID=UPI0009CE9E5F|nr:OB-fold nucleic acid binding domain-containing protein [Methanomethylovorans sp. PtaU1.Bin093]OPY21010.1 MAG: Replication factor A [Methanomethylovorans sp. PtaU1.Bin093]
MNGIDEIYSKVCRQISKEEFIELVHEKLVHLGDLCDEKTAAALVANSLGVNVIENSSQKIRNIKSDSGNVNFIAKVISVSPTKEFTRGDGTTGRVGNLIVADDTGSIRITLWDEKADLVNDNTIQIGQNLKIGGYVKEGYSGVEVNIGNNGVLAIIEEEVQVKHPSTKISEIKEGMGGINVVGRLLDISDVRTFKKKDGSEGRVGNIMIGDDTGKIRITLWDEKTDKMTELRTGDSVEIINGYARQNNFNQQIEIQIGNNSFVNKSETSVKYQENFTPISDIVPGESYSIQGSVSGLGEIREFNRDDGTVNMVSNIYVSDDTGRIRVALWADHALLVDELDIATPVQIIDAYAKSGFNEDVELSAGNRTRIIINP